MKKYLVLGAIISCILLIAGKGKSNLADLNPVELVSVTKTGEGIYLRTNTGRIGFGDSVKAAWEDMNHHADGMLFLDTADYLLVSDECILKENGLEDIFRPGIRVLKSAWRIDLMDAAKYLSYQKAGVPLEKAKAKDQIIPLLKNEERGFAVELF